MLSFPCFSKYFESYLDVRTYSIVFPRKIVVPWVIYFPRVIAFPSILVKKKIGTIYSFLLHPFTLAHSTPGSVCQKKKKKTHSCHCRLRHLKWNQIQIDWFMRTLNQVKETELSGSSRLMYIFSSFDVTFSWGSLSHEERLRWTNDHLNIRTKKRKH